MPNRYTYRLIYVSFFLSVVISFFYLRPLNSPWHRFIAGDGLGYYAYLPATFIYDDKNYSYTWFNEVFKEEYSVIATAPGVEHFTTKYKDRRINKYYPGLSLLWLPFFALAHLCALVFQFPANGYSLPYQWSIGLASLFYLFIGLYYLRKLLFRFYGKAWLACLLPVFIFYGTALFDYAINLNSLSHVYSFSLITAFVYYMHRYFNEDEDWTRFLFISVFILILIVLIRPLNVLIMSLIPALVPVGFRFQRPGFFHLKLKQFIWPFLSLAVLSLQLNIIKRATGDFFPNTYSGESFNFFKAQLSNALFGFQYGLFIYSPLLLIALPGVFFVARSYRKYTVLMSYFLFLYLYSSWWFWPITSRATVDVLVLPAILLGGWFSRFSIRFWPGRLLLFLCLILSIYYQLKAYQFRNGILDRNYTHASLYFQNFFKCKPGLIFAVPPASIVKQTNKEENFENVAYQGTISQEHFHSGNRAAKLDHSNLYSKEITSDWPRFMSETGIPKMRISFWLFAVDEMKEGQLYANFYDPDGNTLLSIPFYLKEREMGKECWSYLELGHEFGPEQARALEHSKVSVFFWNTKGANALYIDDFRIEFLLCDRSSEIVP